LGKNIRQFFFCLQIFRAWEHAPGLLKSEGRIAKCGPAEEQEIISMGLRSIENNASDGVDSSIVHTSAKKATHNLFLMDKMYEFVPNYVLGSIFTLQINT
jgi:hypothetical protein